LKSLATVLRFKPNPANCACCEGGFSQHADNTRFANATAVNLTPTATNPIATAVEPNLTADDTIATANGLNPTAVNPITTATDPNGTAVNLITPVAIQSQLRAARF
jgi:3-deoxy-D-arabino-heptulosonate 7-phosphate (DAHP) synthase class II